MTPEYVFFGSPPRTSLHTGFGSGQGGDPPLQCRCGHLLPHYPHRAKPCKQVGSLWAEGYVKEYYRGEEEIGVMSAIAGSSPGRSPVHDRHGRSGTHAGHGSDRILAGWPDSRRTPHHVAGWCMPPWAIQPDNVELAYLLNCGIILLHGENQQDFFDYTMKAFIISERPEVTLPVAVAVDGFFVTHARGYVNLPSKDIKLQPRDPYAEAVPAMDNENPPARLSRDAPIQKSNFISYQVHASWQQEVWAANERARRYINKYMGGLIEVVNPDAEIMLIASGSAVSQSREAVRQAEEEHNTKVGLIKVRSIRPFPTPELRAACKHAKRILVPEFNYMGWLHREIVTALYGHCKAEIVPGPRVYGGMSMPTEMILQTIFPDKNSYSRLDMGTHPRARSCGE
ncbi:MAG: hypothetical protein D084_Lepto4C00318G0001, partial [Leptospirillum sp. Group IV 'UBA BS']